MPTELTAAIAAIHYEKDFDINGTLRQVVKRLQADRVKVGGVLQTAAMMSNQCCVRLFIVDIQTGQTQCITQDRGPNRVAASLIRVAWRKFHIVLRRQSKIASTCSSSTSLAGPNPRAVVCYRVWVMRSQPASQFSPA